MNYKIVAHTNVHIFNIAIAGAIEEGYELDSNPYYNKEVGFWVAVSKRDEPEPEFTLGANPDGLTLKDGILSGVLYADDKSSECEHSPDGGHLFLNTWAAYCSYCGLYRKT